MPLLVRNKKPASPSAHKKPARKPRPHQHLAAWLRSPLKVGAVVPSSRALARAMARQVDIASPGSVIELGPGTGVVTHALLAAGVKPQQLFVIERDKRMFGVMKSIFPDLHILCADALELDKVAASAGMSPVNAIVSSLPLLSMPKMVRVMVEKHMAALIGEKGIIVQFTYGPKSPISADELLRYRLWGKRVKIVVANIPPAHVWVYRRERRKSKR